MGSKSFTGEPIFLGVGLLRLESGEATSNTFGPTLSWKFALGSTGSGLPEYLSRGFWGWAL